MFLMKKTITIKTAAPTDAAELLKIYQPYVEKTAISFEYETPSVEEFERRIRETLARYPYFVAKTGEELVGYAYASTFKGRPAYDWSVETTIYIREDSRGQGIGRRLYEALENALRKQNILNVNACIAVTDTDDPYVTNASMHFHEHMGYRLVGRFHQSGYKFHRWYDMIWMEKMLGEHTQDAAQPIPFCEFVGQSST
jgi:phosphinothricin acetyltransferase